MDDSHTSSDYIQLRLDFTYKIERNKGPEFNWEQAVQMVKAGKAVASGKWKLQAEADGNLLTGQLAGDGKYHWLDPIYLAPILFELKWHEVAKSVI